MDAVVAILSLLATAVVNGAVTWGIIQAKLENLNDGVKEAKANANAAHARIDRMLEGR